MSVSYFTGLITNNSKLDTFLSNILFLCFAVFFFLIPVLLFVVGKDSFKLRSRDILKKEYWVEFGRFATRALFWFFGAGCFASAYFLISRFIKMI